MPKIIFLTGGTGSFGLSFVKHLLDDPDVSMVRIFSRDEHKQREMRDRFKTDRVSFFIGDVRDKDRLIDAMIHSHFVVHAAALKQAPIGEIEPQEFIKTNILGSINVITASKLCGIEKCLLLSTDKAVEPINLYGATKMCAERAFLQADALRGLSRTRFACTRYGNVAYSKGSIIPILESLSPLEPSVIYDANATRFWIDLNEANKFVLESLKKMSGGEIFIPKLKSVRIVDIVEAIRPGCPVVVGNPRPGDKTHEVLSINGRRYQSNENEFMSVEDIRNAISRDFVGKSQTIYS